jgi:Domain of unknown function (DUF4431)
VTRCLAMAVAVFVAAPWEGSAFAECLKANQPGQIVEGRLRLVRIEIPDYGKRDRAFVLMPVSAACLDGVDDYDKVERAHRIHVFTLEETLSHRLRQLVGKRVQVWGEAFGAHTVHHHGPIVMRIGAIEPAKPDRQR